MNIQEKVWKKIAPFVTELPYRRAIAKYKSQLPALNSLERNIIETCKREGVCTISLAELGLSATAAMLEGAKQQLAVMEQIRPEQEAIEPAYPQIFTVTDLSEFSDWGNEPSLLRMVENYIGLPIAFQGIHLRRDFANRKPVTTEFWHQDLEDRRMLKAILYLTDVDEEHGPFEYIPKSQITPLLGLRIRLQTLFKLLYARISNSKDVIGLNDREIEKIVPRSKWKTCLGQAGTVVFVDPVAIFHHGKSRKLGRSTLFFVYTAQRPLRPERCRQYSDATFARPSSALTRTHVHGGAS